eukprot:GHUV01057284.1.p1 GENE.GHUV01057284.1~~GHUV01057284.1.p1  ORF type:complete len:225 (+),score=26.46 GHUV01057284.1:1635-2309(+)
MVSRRYVLFFIALTSAVSLAQVQQQGTCTDPLISTVNCTAPRAGTYQCSTDGSLCCTDSSTSDCPVCGAISFRPSVLYGCSGEQWRPNSRLIDFSYAGYRAGVDPIPTMPKSVDLKVSYGAKGDGTTDDTAAFLAAINDVTDQAVIYIPSGRYIIKQKLEISQRVVFQGAGRNETTLVFAKSLTDLYSNTWSGGNSQWTYGPALMNFWGAGRTDATTLLAAVTR